MYKKEEYLKKYFFYGIENKQMLEQGILFAVARFIHEEDKNRDCIGLRKTRERRDAFYKKERKHEKIPKEELQEYYSKRRKIEDELNKESKNLNFEQLIERATNLWEQYYKFIVLPDNKECYKPDLEEKQKKAIKSYVRNLLNKLIENGKLMKYPLGMYFNREVEGIMNKNEWTQQISEILQYYSKLEKECPVSYNIEWIRVRVERAENRKDRDEQEIKNMRQLKEIFEKKRKEYMELEKAIG